MKKVFAPRSYRDQLYFSSNYLGFRGDFMDLADSQTPQGVSNRQKKNGSARSPSGQFLLRCPRSWQCRDHDSDGGCSRFYRSRVSDKSADIYRLKTLRSMQGSHFHLPIYRLPRYLCRGGARRTICPFWQRPYPKNRDYRRAFSLKTLF